MASDPEQRGPVEEGGGCPGFRACAGPAGAPACSGAGPGLPDRVLALIRDQRVMVLGSCREGLPWTAPVYYLHRDGGFWFFSSPESRHIREVLDQEGRAGASVFEDSPTPDKIRGLQMTGRVWAPGTGAEALAAGAAYAVRFAIPVAGGKALEAIMGRFRATLYCFRPETAVFMDNAIRFGHRESLTL